MPKKARNYVRERKLEPAKRKEARKARGRARTALGLKDGDKRTVQHRDGNPRNNSRKNLTTTTNKRNSSQGGRKGNRAGKARGGRK